MIERLSPLEGGSSCDWQKMSSYANSIIAESWRISNTAEKLVLLLSEKAGNPVSCSVDRCVQRALSKLRTRHKADVNTVQFSTPESEVPTALIDQDQFIVLLSELLENALQQQARDKLSAAPALDEPEPEISVNASIAGPTTVIAVRSRSTAACPFDLPTLFEPLVTAYGEEKHIGIGLSTAQAIVERANGIIEVEELSDPPFFVFTAMTICNLGVLRQAHSSSMALRISSIDRLVSRRIRVVGVCPSKSTDVDA